VAARTSQLPHRRTSRRPDPEELGMKVVAVDGSPTGGGRTETALRAVLDGAAASGAEVELRSLAAADAFAPVREALGAADAVVFGSPVYRASFAFPLKTFLDELPRGMWGETEEPIRAKATGIVLTGASWHHYLALDDLRGNLSGFFAAHVLAPGLYVPNELYDEAKQLVDRAREPAERTGAGLVALAGAIASSPALAAIAPQA
jgi:FMN reductase